jgi:hypothetical protein
MRALRNQVPSPVAQAAVPRRHIMRPAALSHLAIEIADFCNKICQKPTCRNVRY